MAIRIRGVLLLVVVAAALGVAAGFTGWTVRSRHRSRQLLETANAPEPAPPTVTTLTSQDPPLLPALTPEPSAAEAQGPPAEPDGPVANPVVAQAPPPGTASSVPVLGEWVELPEYPLSVVEAQGTLMSCGPGVVVHVVVGGFTPEWDTTFEMYTRDVSSDTNPWQAAAPMPDDAGHPLTHMAQAVKTVPDGLGDTLYLVGGYLGAHPGPSWTSAYAYHCPTDTWTVLPDIPAPRSGGGLVHLEGYDAIVFAGGVDRKTQGNKPNSKITDLIDYGTTWMLYLSDVARGWQLVSENMPNPRNHQAGVNTCGELLWIGGQHEDDEEEGNQITNSRLLQQEDGSVSWDEIANLPLPLGHVSASSIAYKCGVLTVGGITQSRTHTDEVMYWDPVADEWTIIGSYPTGTATPVCGIWENTVYCATGSDTRNLVYKASLT